ncbi:MAG: ATP-binding protein [Bacteroidales bacterium]|nr:ATP-binding protein [Bacteroidales bacterium]
MENQPSIYEKLGLFYLGKEVNPDTQELTDDLLLYKSKHLTTHAALIGMTGSGKTGLGIDIIEEAVLDNIPAIIIDPKGDMGNLLLTFPELKPENFEPWVDAGTAETKGLSVKEFAAKTAAMWDKGIQSWHQDKSRIKTLKNNAEYVIYTPGSSAGVQLSVLSSFDAPSEDTVDDPDTFTSVINSTVSSILALINIKGDILQSKEYLLLSSIFLHLWRKGISISLEELIGYVTNPPFDKIGVLPLKSFYDQKDRLDLAMKLNTVLASPGFAAWTEGENLDIQNLLYTEDGKAKVSILSISHLDESQRMFFVTLFLNRYISWMRQQSGTSSLKALLYMDEIFGYFPAVGNPPSKKPMLLLLKQARAYGISVILATQNPIDLDYKGLSNIGTWFIGRLQTKQDKERVMDGLLKSNEGSLDKKEIESLLSNIQSRVFLFKSAHEDRLKLMQTRWVLSYLRGPLSKKEVRKLMADKKEKTENNTKKTEQISASNKQSATSDAGANVVQSIISNEIEQYYSVNTAFGKEITYEPYLIAEGKVKFVNAARGIEIQKSFSKRYYLDEEMSELDFAEGEDFNFDAQPYDKKPTEQSRFYALPGFIEELKNLKPLEKAFSDFLYRNNKLELYKCTTLKAESKPGESLRDFKVRLLDVLRDKKAEAVEKLRTKYGTKGDRLQDRYERLMIKLDKEKSDVSAKQTDTAMSLGMAVLGSFLGSSTKRRVNSSISSATKIAKEKADVRRAQQEILQVKNDMQELRADLARDIDLIKKKFNIDNYQIDTFYIKPKRSDVFDIDTALFWEAK